MTLIVSFCHHDCIVTVSDRRFTIRKGDLYTYDDNRNKILLFQDRYLISFTGIANLGAIWRSQLLDFKNFGTDIWLLQYFARYDSVTDAFNNLGMQLKRKCNTNLFRGSMIAVKAAGWKRLSLEPDGIVPIAFVWSNFDITTLEMLSADGLTFLAQEIPMRPTDGICAIGAPILPTVLRAFNRKFQVNAQHGRPIETQIHSTIRMMRYIAKSNNYVGCEYLISMIPKKDAMPHTEVFAAIGSFDRKHTSFFYLPSDRKPPYRLESVAGVVQYGPHVALGDGYGYADYEVQADGPDQSIQCRIMAIPGQQLS